MYTPFFCSFLPLRSIRGERESLCNLFSCCFGASQQTILRDRHVHNAFTHAHHLHRVNTLQVACREIKNTIVTLAIGEDTHSHRECSSGNNPLKMQLAQMKAGNNNQEEKRQITCYFLFFHFYYCLPLRQMDLYNCYLWFECDLVRVNERESKRTQSAPMERLNGFFSVRNSEKAGDRAKDNACNDSIHHSLANIYTWIKLYKVLRVLGWHLKCKKRKWNWCL